MHPRDLRLSRQWMHEDGCINAYDIFVHLHHGLPPVFLDIILQQTAIRL